MRETRPFIYKAILPGALEVNLRSGAFRTQPTSPRGNKVAGERETAHVGRLVNSTLQNASLVDILGRA